MTMAGPDTAQVAIVTGGASGLGEAIAQRLARDAMTVIVVDIQERLGQQVADNLKAAGLRAEAETCDVTQEGEVAALVESVVERHGRLHHLVCSAAIETRARLTETTDDAWQQVLDVNLKGPWLCMKHAIPAIATAGGGAVVLLGSILGAIGQPGYAAYCASKGALVNLAKQAAIEHAPDAVRVNVVSPSATDTGLFMQMANASGDPAAIINMVTRGNPMRRLGTAAEVADTVAFLCSPGAGYLSGAVIPLDGGMAARRIV
jgi:NAD(P)-dependent dehydrogenase (short-subunit alcohol dehydrogenase family)